MSSSIKLIVLYVVGKQWSHTSTLLTSLASFLARKLLIDLTKYNDVRFGPKVGQFGTN